MPAFLFSLYSQVPKHPHYWQPHPEFILNFPRLIWHPCRLHQTTHSIQYFYTPFRSIGQFIYWTQWWEIPYHVKHSWFTSGYPQVWLDFSPNSICFIYSDFLFFSSTKWARFIQQIQMRFTNEYFCTFITHSLMSMTFTGFYLPLTHFISWVSLPVIHICLLLAIIEVS